MDEGDQVENAQAWNVQVSTPDARQTRALGPYPRRKRRYARLLRRSAPVLLAEKRFPEDDLVVSGNVELAYASFLVVVVAAVEGAGPYV